MAFWSKKKISDALKKYFNDKKVDLEKENDTVSFEYNITNNNFILYPYITIYESEEKMNIRINIREVKDDCDYNKLNGFNLVSKYFTCKIKDKVIYLEYNTFCDYDNCVKILEECFSNINSLGELIDNL